MAKRSVEELKKLLSNTKPKRPKGAPTSRRGRKLNFPAMLSSMSGGTGL